MKFQSKKEYSAQTKDGSEVKVLIKITANDCNKNDTESIVGTFAQVTHRCYLELGEEISKLPE